MDKWIVMYDIDGKRGTLTVDSLTHIGTLFDDIDVDIVAIVRK